MISLGTNLGMAVVLGQFIVILLLVFYVIVISVRLRKIRQILNKLTEGVSKGNWESVLGRWLERMEGVEQKFSDMNERIQAVDSTVQSKAGNIGLVRFNAFAHEGSDLSFSIAIMDNSSNGLVLTSIYGREESRVYAKPIEAGNSKYHLTDEERQAIEIAKQKVQL